MRTTLTLDPDVYRAATSLSRSSGRRLGKVVSELARAGLRQPRARIRKGGKNRLPVFILPPGAPPMTAGDLQRYLDEEGHF